MTTRRADGVAERAVHVSGGRRGRRRSSRNATRHGLYSEQTRMTPAEKGRFYRKVKRYLAAFESPDPEALALARSAATARIRIERIRAEEIACLEESGEDRAIRLVVRHLPRQLRALSDALVRLAELSGSGSETEKNARNEECDGFTRNLIQ